MRVAPFSLLSQLQPRVPVGWIGIDIGSHSVKLAQLAIVDGHKQIVDAAIIPIPDSSTLSVNSLQTGWLARALRSELSRHRGFRGRSAACGMSMSLTDFRSIVIPPGSDQERREMIAEDLAESGGLGAIEFDFWEGHGNPADAAGVEPPVNVLSVSSALATEVAMAVQDSGLNCQVLDGGPFALARAAQLAGRERAHDQPIAVLDWGHGAAHFAIIVAGQPAFSRVLKNCGVGSLVAAVKKGVNLSLDDCHQLLSTCGIPNPQLGIDERTDLQELVSEFTDELLNELIVELDKTVSYLRSQRPELIPVELILVGGGATIRNIDAKLNFESGLPTAPWRLPQFAAGNGTIAGLPVELLAQAAALSELAWQS